MPTAMITPSILRDPDGAYSRILREAGLEVRFPSVTGRQLTEAELLEELGDAEAVLAGPEPYSATVIEKHPRMRVISRAGVGYDAVDLDAASSRGVAVGFTPGTNHEAVAEHAMTLMLGICRNVLINHREVVDGSFRRHIMRPVRGKTLGIVGLGRIGRAVAHRALAFGMTVLVFDPYVTDRAPDADGPRVVSLPELLSESDIVTLHAPLTEDTTRLIRGETLEQMKDGVILLNTARGGLVDESALAAALHSGKVAAAGLDVYEAEPPVGSPLLSAPNLLLSPHVSSLDDEALMQMAVMVAQNIADLYSGRWPEERLVNADRLGSTWAWTR